MNDVKIDVAALAKLARLEVSEQELAKLEKEIPNILEFVRTIQNIDVSNAPVSHGLRNVMRPDENPHESGMHTEAMLRAAPAREGNRIAVKQVLSRKKKS